MSPTRLQRDGATLEAVRDAVREEFGPAARIIAAERVTTPGIAGLFRRAHVEATVEVPSPDEAPFKQPGDAVAAGETVGLVEAMKSFFPVEADVAGAALRFLVEDGAAVDADQPVAETE